MEKPFISRGFTGKHRQKKEVADRIPPGQHLENDFPVLSAGPTPKVATATWQFRIEGLVRSPVHWNWQQFMQLPQQSFKADIHCVTTWSKLDTKWRGVSVGKLLESAEILPEASHVMAFCYGGYTTNLPLEDLLGGKAFIGLQYEGYPLSPEHGGPARLVVPHLYFWKSAKWIQGLRLIQGDQAGFWEELGYHMYGDPWKEQRYEE